MASGVRQQGGSSVGAVQRRNQLLPRGHVPVRKVGIRSVDRARRRLLVLGLFAVVRGRVRPACLPFVFIAMVPAASLAATVVIAALIAALAFAVGPVSAAAPTTPTPTPTAARLFFLTAL